MNTPPPLCSFTLPPSIYSSTSETAKYSIDSIIFNWLRNGVDVLVISGKNLVNDLSHPLISHLEGGLPVVKLLC